MSDFVGLVNFLSSLLSSSSLLLTRRSSLKLRTLVCEPTLSYCSSASCSTDPKTTKVLTRLAIDKFFCISRIFLAFVVLQKTVLTSVSFRMYSTYSAFIES